MSYHLDLPLFSGRPAAEPINKAKPRRPTVKPTLSALSTGSRLVALPLARNRHVIDELVRMFRKTSPGPNRAAMFHQNVLLPLISQRVALGLDISRVEIEAHALEVAMVRVLLRDEPDAGYAG